MKSYKSALKVLEEFESNLGYEKPQEETGTKNKTLSSLKKCFQLMSSSGKINLPSDKKYDLKDLFIDGFDQEQIWQQIELRNRFLPAYVPVITKVLLDDNNLVFPCLKEKEELLTSSDPIDEVENLEERMSTEENSDENNESDEESMLSGASEPNVPLGDHEPLIITKKQRKKKVVSSRKSVVDDDFFKIDEMEKFLDEAEKDDLGDNYDGIDYFEDIPSDLETGLKNAKYADFFQNPDSENEDDLNLDNEDDFSNVKDSQKKRVKFTIDNNASEESSSDEIHGFEEIENEEFNNGFQERKKMKFSGNVSDENEDEDKTTFQLRELRLKKKISKLEENNLSEKPWKYKGEVDTSERPVNSLLEEVLDVESTLRPPPVITENVTNTLEQIIINRIKDSAYDDVERKIKPVHIPHELKKDLVLNQEKSKYSLAEVYEQEYLKRKPGNELAEDNSKPNPEKEKIIKMMKAVFHKLDVLSNFHYTPKPVSADVEIVSNMPAITIEEVTPAAVSDANLLAPQEVGDTVKRKLLGKDERSKTDKKRERRKKKAFMSRKFKKGLTTENKISKVLKSKNVDLMKQSLDSNVKSSTSFFTKLQENNEVGKLVKIKKKKHSEL